MGLVYIIHDKGKLFTIVDPSAWHFESKILPLKSLYSPKKIRQHVEQMPFFENTEILRQGRRNWGGGQEGQPPPCPLPGGAREAKVPFQFKGLPWRNSELSEMLVQFFYEFASENARNAVIELQE